MATAVQEPPPPPLEPSAPSLPPSQPSRVPSEAASLSPSLRSPPPPPKPALGPTLLDKQPSQAAQVKTFLEAAEVGGLSDLSKDPSAVLQAAARIGDLSQVKDAVVRGADINVDDSWGLAPLHSAAIGGHADVVTLLLEKQATIDRPNLRGQTALHLAASEGHVEVVLGLIDRLADVMKKSSHGCTALEMAKNAGNSCEQVIRDELARRYEHVMRDVTELKRRLAVVESIKTVMESELGQGSSEPTEEDGSEQLATTGQGKKKSKGSKKGAMKITYWQSVHKAIEKAHAIGESAVALAWLREQPIAGGDDVPLRGPVTTVNPFPPPDPDDEELVASFQRLRLVAAEHKRWRGMKAKTNIKTPVDDMVKAHSERQMIETTSRTQQEWNELVADISTPGYEWDWSKLEVRERSTMGPKKMEMMVVFAVDDGTGESTPVFKDGDIIGPIAGVVRRRTKYEMLYYPGHKWKFHDPMVYSFNLRAQTTELKLEPLVVDMYAGSSQNRLRHLADARADPLGLRQLMATASKDGETLAPPRGSMPRVRSRPGSPMPLDSPADFFMGSSMSKMASESRQSEDLATMVNVKIVEVLVDGWPYAFAVALEDIHAGQELAVDFGDIHWTAQRASLTRLRDIGKISTELVKGISASGDDDGDDEEGGAKDKEPVQEKRQPMPRAEAPVPYVPAKEEEVEPEE